MAVALTNDVGFVSAVSELTLAPDDPIKTTELYNKKIFRNLIHNDRLIAGKFANIPKIWECLWYNDPTKNGYAAGTVCWRNIEDIRDFIYAHYSDIYGYAVENKHILTKPVRIVNVSQLNDGDTYDDYVNVLTGWVNKQRTSEPLCMLYDLGDVANPPQVYVSIVDNNKRPLDDRTGWKPILVTERSVFKELSVHGQQLIKTAFDNHLSMYHMGNEPEGSIRLNLSAYLNVNLDNFDFPFEFYVNPVDQVVEGMDWPIKFVEKPLVFSERGHDLSGAIVEHRWFRLWKSGYLEHGGTVDLLRNFNRHGFPEIHYNWPLTGLTGNTTDGARVADMGYLGGRGETTSRYDDTALCVYEGLFPQNNEPVPGDNLLSVLHSSNGILSINTDFTRKEYREMDFAPVFNLSVYPYHLEICPIVPEFPDELSGVVNGVEETDNPFPYPNMNIGLQCNLFDAEMLSDGFQISSYEVESGMFPRFVSYYASGWSIKYREDELTKNIDKGLPSDIYL